MVLSYGINAAVSHQLELDFMMMEMVEPHPEQEDYTDWFHISTTYSNLPLGSQHGYLLLENYELQDIINF